MGGANPYRGEVSVTLAGRNLVLRPTYEAMAKIEADLGRGLLPLVQQFARRDIGITDVACVVFHGAAAGGTDMELAEAGALVTGEGFADAAKAATDLLTNALTGGAKPKKDAALQPAGAKRRRKPPAA